ncbi:polysaccharide pyruvyl transferase family protein [bacterium]|nr:polysaccharide pyruvyl transferase family protein [bacterium]
MTKKNIFNTLIKRNRNNYLPDEQWIKEKDHKSIVIHHYCPRTFNAGDHFVVLSIRKHISRLLPNAVFVPKAVAYNRGWGKPIGLNGENIRISNEYADAVIIGGSDQYYKWSPRILAGEIENLIPPLFLIGLGASSKDLDSLPFLGNDTYRKDILAVNQKSRLSSVRDIRTREFLENLGYMDSIVTGCPALYLFDENLHVNLQSKNILLTFPYPVIRKKTQENKYQILIKLVKNIIPFISASGFDPIIVCHDDRDVPAAQKLFPDQLIFFSNYTHDYFQLYKNAKMVIGSRLHATILALSQGTPAININLDIRGQGFSETFGLTKWNINYTENDIEERLVSNINQLLSGNLSDFINFQKERDHHHQIFLKFIKETVKIILNN